MHIFNSFHISDPNIIKLCLWLLFPWSFYDSYCSKLPLSTTLFIGSIFRDATT